VSFLRTKKPLGKKSKISKVGESKKQILGVELPQNQTKNQSRFKANKERANNRSRKKRQIVKQDAGAQSGTRREEGSRPRGKELWKKKASESADRSVERGGKR